MTVDDKTAAAPADATAHLQSKPRTHGFWCHLAAIAFVVMLTAIPYASLPRASFCGYDDFVEVHRAVFEDTQQPSRIFSTSHFGGVKYRPLNRAINYLTYRAGGFDATLFRFRNCLFHLVNVALLYLLGVLLFRSIAVAAAGALLFGLHPLANQPVAGAVMTNTTAATLFLLAVLCFLVSSRVSERRLRWMLLSVFCGWVGALTYEADIAVFGLMFASLLFDYLPTRRMSWSKMHVLALLTVQAAGVVSLTFMRAQVQMHGRPHMAAAWTVARDAAMYTGALLLPIDPLLAKRWFGTPLPSPLHLAQCAPWIVVFGLLFAVLALSLRKRIAGIAARIDKLHSAFLLLAAVLSISPLLIFNDHPSETYLYLPLAFCGLLFAHMSSVMMERSRTLWVTVIALLSVLFAFATTNRVERVRACGDTAREILTELPLQGRAPGDKLLYFASVPGEPTSQRYGLYGYKGLETIGTGADGGIPALTQALQLQAQDGQFRAQVLSAADLMRSCQKAPASQHEPVCFWVHSNGHTEAASGIIPRPATDNTDR